MNEFPPISELLKRNTIFADLSAAELEEIAHISEFQKYAKDTLVFSKEAEARYMYLVLEGSFILHLHGQAYKAFEPNEIFGEIAVINRQLRTGAVRAKTDSIALAICGHQLFDQELISATTA
ncbi:MAG: cyclic nucleotide-binding domain-containing protein, partial [Bacteroidota bacterium]